ncbi:MAG: glycosyltransferase family 2 protein [Magnetococcus sp. YQC-5]
MNTPTDPLQNESVKNINSAIQTKFDRSVSVLTWGLNEQNLLISFLDNIFSLMDATVEEYEVIFVDDGSNDNSPAILREYAARNPLLKVITNSKPLNVGLALRRAIEVASKEYLFWQTVDWSYDIRNLRIFLELLRHYDAVQGVRPVPERLLSHIPLVRSIYRVKTRSDKLSKAVISLGNYYLLRILFNVNFHDFQNITFYKTRTVKSLNIQGKTSFVNPELLFKYHAQGMRFIEVPIHFIPRKSGVAKGTRFPVVVKSILDLLYNWWRWGRTLHKTGAERHPIHRVSFPFNLNDETLRLVIPLFKDLL